MRTLLPLLICALALPEAAPAQDAGDSISLPGTPAMLAHLAGKDRAVPRAELLRELVRMAHSTDRVDPALARLRQALPILRDIRTLLADPNRLSPTDGMRSLGYRLSQGVRSELGGDDARWRRQLATALGLTRGHLDALQGGRLPPLTVATFDVPLPLGREYWQRHIVGQPHEPEELVETILGNRQAGLLYFGLTGLDPETVQWFGEQDGLIDTALNRPVPFAEFSASIRVRSGRVVTPLGAEADAVWTALVEAHPDRPREFVRKLLTQDNGRLAWFYDSVARYPLPIQKFVLANWRPVDERQDDVWETYEWFREFQTPVTFLKAPFVRAPFDPEIALMLVRVDSAGNPEPPSSTSFVRKSFESLSLDPVRENSIQGRGTDALRAADVLDLIFGGPPQNVIPVAHAFYYAQRLASSAVGGTPEQFSLAIRGRIRFPALSQALERVPVTNPEVIALTLRRAEALSRIGERQAAHASILQFQSSVGLLQSMAASGGLVPEAAEQLIAELSYLETDPRGDYLGAVARWWRDSALTRVSASVEPGQAGADQLVLAALAGLSASRAMPRFEWTGFRYVADRSAFELRRLREIREAQRQPRFETILDFVTALDALPSADSRDVIQRLKSDMARLANDLIDTIPGSIQQAASLPIVDELRRALGDLARVRTGEDLPGWWTRENLLVLADWFTGYALLSLNYAAALPDARDPLLADGDVSWRHDLGSFLDNRRERESVTWELPSVLVNGSIRRRCTVGGHWYACEMGVEPAPGRLWHAAGSILNLDLKLAPVSRVRDGLPYDDRLSVADWRALAAAPSLTLSGRPEMGDLTARVAAQLGTARQRIGPEAESLALRPGWRFAALPWVASHAPDDLAEHLTPVELLNLDEQTPIPSTVRAGLGGAMDRLSGCVCLDLPSLHTDFLLGRNGAGYLGASGANLRLRLVELLGERGYPAVLLEPLYTLLVRELSTSRLVNDSGDWSAILRAFQAAPADKLEQLIGDLQKAGLVRFAGEGGDDKE